MRTFIDNKEVNRADYNDEEWGKMIVHSNSMTLIDYLTPEEVVERFGYEKSPIELLGLEFTKKDGSREFLPADPDIKEMMEDYLNTETARDNLRKVNAKLQS